VLLWGLAAETILSVVTPYPVWAVNLGPQAARAACPFYSQEQTSLGYALSAVSHQGRVSPALFREADVERSQPVFNSHRRGVGGGFPEERLTSRLFHSPPSEACRASSPPTGKRPSEFRERPCRCRARKFHLQEQSLECAASRLRPTATLSERRSGLSWHTFLVRADPQIDADAPPRSSCR
jgi:hypothetical protein